MMTLLEPFVMLMPWWRVDVGEGDFIEAPPPWFSWGYLNRSNGEPKAWYILIKLPSYRFGLPEWADDAFFQRPCWWQRLLLFKEPMPVGVGSWQFTEMWLPNHE